MNTFIGNIRGWDDAALELSRLHALCDIANDYITESGDEIKTKMNNTSFALQMIHDAVIRLENEFEQLASKSEEKAHD